MKIPQPVKATAARAATAAGGVLTGTVAVDAIEGGDFTLSAWSHIVLAAVAAAVMVVHDALAGR